MTTATLAPLPASAPAIPAASASRGSARWLALGAVVGPLLFTLAWLILGVLSPGYSIFGTLVAPYSPISQPISGLGMGPTGPYMNAAFVLSGLSLLIGVIGVFKSLPRTANPAARGACAALLALTPAGLVVAGIFTLESAFLHLIGALLGLVSPVLSFLTAGLLLRGLPGWQRFGNGLLLVASPLTLVLVIIFFSSFDQARTAAGLGVAGLTQRILAVELLGWFAVMGWRAFTGQSTAPRKPYGGRQMEGPVAAWYARITRDRKDRPKTVRAISNQLPAGSAVLEVAPGPGYLAVELAKSRPGAYRIAGLDISHSFVRIARENARRAGVAIDFRQGDVAHMPFASESFDFVVCQAAFKNFPDPVAALDEMHRVLKSGGRVTIFDLRKDATLEDVEQEVRDMRLWAPSAFLTKLIFRYALLREAYTRHALEAVVARSRFGRGEIVQDGIGFELRLTR